MIIRKFKKYISYCNKIYCLYEKTSKLRHNMQDVFFSKFKNNGEYLDAKNIFDMFLNNPDEIFWKEKILNWDSYLIQWHKVSKACNYAAIIQELLKYKFIIKVESFEYQLNPEVANLLTPKIKQDLKQLG